MTVRKEEPPVNPSEELQSVKRALDILDLISEVKEIGIRELSRKTGFSRGSVQRLVNTLVEGGYLSQNPINQKYHLSFKLFKLGHKALLQNDLRSISHPFLELLQRKIQEAIVLGTLENGEIVYVDKLSIAQEIQLASNIGSRVPIHCTATGKAVLAFLPPDERAAILQPKNLKAYTNRTITDLVLLETELAAIKERGYAIDYEERFPGVISIAAPIWDFAGRTMGAVGVPGFVYRITDDRIPSIGAAVVRCANQISFRLGYQETTVNHIKEE